MKHLCVLYVGILAFTASSVSGRAPHHAIEPDHTLFKQLDDYSLMSIFDWLDIADLANIAQLGRRYQEIIIRHYILPKYRLNEAEIKLLLTEDSGTQLQYAHPNAPHMPQPMVYGFNASLSMINAFCHLFGELTIVIDNSYAQQSTAIEQLVDSITKYCADARQTIRLESMGDIFKLNVPFPNVKIVQLDSIFGLLHPADVDNIDLNHLFPQMEELYSTYDANFPLDRNYPQLTRFELNDKPVNHRDLTNFLKLNPQLQSISAQLLANAANIQKVNELLPSLRELTLLNRHWTNSPVNYTIRFRNVETLALHLFGGKGEIPSSMRETLTAMRFDRLDTFKLVSKGAATDSRRFLVDFIIQQKNLTSIELLKFDLTNDEIMQIVNSMDHLKTLTLSCSKPDTEEVLTQFLLEGSSIDNIIVARARGKCLGLDGFVSESTKRQQTLKDYELLTLK